MSRNKTSGRGLLAVALYAFAICAVVFGLEIRLTSMRPPVLMYGILFLGLMAFLLMTEKSWKRIDSRGGH